MVYLSPSSLLAAFGTCVRQLFPISGLIGHSLLSRITSLTKGAGARFLGYLAHIYPPIFCNDKLLLTLEHGRYYQKLRLISTVLTNRPRIALLVIKISPAQLPPRRNGAPSKSTSENSKCRTNMSGPTAPP